jgi:hypothetical protein
MIPGFCIELDCSESKNPESRIFERGIRTLNHRATKTRKEPTLLRIMGRSVRMAAVVVIALAGCASNFATTDWDDDPNTPDAADIMMAQPAALEANVLVRKRAQIPRQIDRNIFGAPALSVDHVAAMSVQNFYCLHKHIREHAPPPLVQIK